MKSLSKEECIIWNQVKNKESKESKIFWKRINKSKQPIVIFQMIILLINILQEVNKNTKYSIKWINKDMKDNQRFTLTLLIQRRIKGILLLTDCWVMMIFQIGCWKQYYIINLAKTSRIISEIIWKRSKNEKES